MPTFCTACTGEFRRRSDGSCGNPLCSRYRFSCRGGNFLKCSIGGPPKRLAGKHGDWRVIKRLGFKQSRHIVCKREVRAARAAQAEADKRAAAENRIQALESRAKGLLLSNFFSNCFPTRGFFFLIVLVRES